jgi:hypothetical protein
MRLKVCVPFAETLLLIAIVSNQAHGQTVPNEGVVSKDNMGGTTNTAAVLYADILSPSDACLAIFQLMGTLPPTGGTLDARGFQGSPGRVVCAYNPYIGPTNKPNNNAVAVGDPGMTGSTTNPPNWIDTPAASQKGAAVYCGIPAGAFLGIVKSVDSSTHITFVAGTGAAAVCPGPTYTMSAKSGQLLLGNTTFSLSFPWIIPSRWRVIGSGRGVFSGSQPNGTGTTIRANMGGTGGTTNATFSTCGSGSTPTSTACTGSSATNTSSTTIKQGTGTALDWTTVITVGSLFQLLNGNYQGTITAVTPTVLTVSVPISANFMNASYNITPAMVQFNPTDTTKLFDATNHAIAFGTSISNLQVDCNGFGAGVGIQNWWGQELSYVRDVGIDNCLGIALDVETNSAMNSGPYADIVSSPGNFPIASTQCVELLNTGDLRGVHGLTCTANATPKVGVDVSTQNVTLDDIHLEGFVTGIEVGANAAANNVTIVNASGGTGSGAMITLVDISSANSSNQINVFGLGAASSSNGSVTNLLRDNITSNTITTANDPSLSLYVIGLASGAGRTVLSSSPNVNTNIGSTIQFVPSNGTIQSQAVGQSLTVQAAPGATSSSGGAVSVTGGSYNGSASGQNGGAVTVHGGDVTNSSASNANVGGAATLSGGNGMAGNASGGPVSVLGGSATSPSSGNGGGVTVQAGIPGGTSGALGLVTVNQPFFAGASIAAGQVLKLVGNNSVAPTVSGTDASRMIGFATQTVTTAGNPVEVQIVGVVNNATTEMNCTRGDWVVIAATGSPSGTVQCLANGTIPTTGAVIGIALQSVSTPPATLSGTHRATLKIWNLAWRKVKLFGVR